MPSASVRLGNGWYNAELGKYTVYNPNTGQLQTYQTAKNLGRLSPDVINAINSGQMQIDDKLFEKTDSNYLGGRSNVNIGAQVQKAADAIIRQYPQMKMGDALKYANQWVNDRIAAGWDANEVEDLAKGAFRDDKELGAEMLKGITHMVTLDELKARDPNATGADVNGGGDGGKGSIQDELRAFAGQMMQAVGPDSPQAKRIAELAAAAGNKYAAGSGVGPGGITARGVAGTAARAHTDLQTQREGIGLQALAAAGNQQFNVDQLKTQLQQQNQQAGVLNASGIGGLIGTGVGLVGGVIGTAYSGGSMASAIPGLMAAGGSAGQAIGGIGQNMNSPQIQYGGGNTSTFAGRNWGTS